MSNLDNFPLGMGLVAIPGETIPAKNLDGYTLGNSVISGNNKFLLIGLVLILFIFLK